MNIAIISDFNIAGIPTYLMRAINKYTEHKARCIIAHDDSFAYDHDILLQANKVFRQHEGKNVITQEEAKEAAAEWVKQCDFFHFGRGIFNWEGVDWNKILNKDNCCIEYYGSELRSGYVAAQSFHERTGFAAITGTDWTITGRLPNSFYHLGQYLTRFGDMDRDQIPHANTWDGEGEFLIATSSAGSPLKGYDVLAEVVFELKKGGLPVKVESLFQMSNSEVLKEKLRCHATFSSIHGGWGMSGVESMFLGHAVITPLDPWVMSLYPNNPTVLANRATLGEKIRTLVEKPTLTKTIGWESREFAIEHFNTKTILKRYLYLWDLIQNREEIMDGGHLPTTIYNF
jgi:hypothetical protein